MAGALILNQYGVPGAWSQPEEDGRRKQGQGRRTDPQPIWGVQVEKDGGKDKAGALILNQYGRPGAWCQPEEDGGGDKAGALILNQYGGPRCVWPERLSSTNMGSQVRGLNLKETEDGSGDKAAALILNQYRGFRSRKTEARTRPERLSSTNMGVQVRGLNLKKTEAGTRPERLSSTNMGVPGAYGRSAYPQPIWGPRCVVST